MPPICRHVLYAAVLLVTGLGSAQAATPTAKHVCDEARANILRARLTYADKPLQDVAYISKIFSSPSRRNEYHVELRDENEWQKKYPDFWMEGYYSMADEKLLGTPLLAHSVGEPIRVQATVSDIDFVDYSPDAPNQRPACRLGVRIDWEKATKP